MKDDYTQSITILSSILYLGEIKSAQKPLAKDGNIIDKRGINDSQTYYRILNPAMQTSVDEVTIIQQKDRMGSDSMIQVKGELNLYGNLF